MKLFSGKAHRELAEKIATHLGTGLADVNVDSFPDGETFVQINENIRGEDVYLMQPTRPATNLDAIEDAVMIPRYIPLFSIPKCTH